MLSFRQAETSDVDLFFNWANDPLTRQNSYKSDAIEYKEHVQWFQKKVVSPKTRMYVFLNDANEPVGQVRFDKSGKEAAYTISINIGEQHRGKGYASEMLSLSANDFFAHSPNARIIAYVFVSNEASFRSFLSAGYRLIEQKDIAGINSYILERTFYEK